MIENKDLQKLERCMVGAGIPTTFEYPGYISISYRSYVLTIGIGDAEKNELLFQCTSSNGTEVAMDVKMKFDTSLPLDAIIDRIGLKLSDAYDIIDKFILQNGFCYELTEAQIMHYIEDRGLTVQKVIDAAIDKNGIIGVGLITLSESIANYIVNHKGAKR